MKPLDFINSLIQLNLLIDKYEIEQNHLDFVIPVWAKPGAKKEKIEISNTGELCVFLSDKAIEGKANKGLKKALAKLFLTSPSQVELISGEKSKHKKFQLSLNFKKLGDKNDYQSVLEKLR